MLYLFDPIKFFLGYMSQIREKFSIPGLPALYCHHLRMLLLMLQESILCSQYIPLKNLDS